MLAVQCKMARAALDLGVRELAAAAEMSTDTVARFERGEELRAGTLDRIRAVFLARGIEFLEGDSPGVRIHKVKSAARKAKPKRKAKR